MKTIQKIYFILLLLSILVTFPSCYAVSNTIDVKIKYMASFLEKTYEFIPPEKPVKFPVEINSWPGEFHEGPDTIDVSVEVKNTTKETLNNVAFDAIIELNTGKIINTDDDEIDEDKSKKNAKYSKFFTKKVTIKQMAPGSKTKILIKRILFGKLMDKYLEKNERIWDCRVNIKTTSKTVIKRLPIEFY